MSNNLKKSRPQEGNAAWLAARDSIKPGYANRRRCSALTRGRGVQCGQLAMKGVPVCRYHGGYMMQAQQRINEGKRNGKATSGNGAQGRRFKRSGKKANHHVTK